MKLYERSANELQQALRTKEISAKEILDAQFSRIEAIESQVESFTTLTHDLARRQAEAVDGMISRGEDLPPLAGIPIAVKDNICTNGIRTTCSSKMLENFIAPYDATVVKNLKEQKAIFVGKANMDEFAMGSSTENSAFHVTRNPWDLSRVPGGSSGGSTAAVAAGEAVLSLGSDTGGSIRQPAALCGVVGMKPTYGLVSRFGLIAFASSLDQIGPISRTVKDNALLLEVLSSHDPCDSTSLPGARENYLEGIEKGVKGLKIGLIEELSGKGIDEEILKKLQEAVRLFEKMGAFVDSVSLPTNRYGIAAYYLIATAEASANLARYDGVKYGLRVDAPDLKSMYGKTRSEGFGEEVKRRIMLGTYALSSGYYDAYYKKAQLVRTRIIEDYRKAFEKFDLLLCPTTPSTAFPLGSKLADPLEMYLADIATVSVNLAGVPALSLPAGLDKKGLPIGIQLIGPHLSEKRIYQAAYAYEQEAGNLKMPGLR
ncbi:MAG TPA: Asp-tRNA(Asn)/Glu-tRNA(Gln) amidotransferase subunit GatA [Chroococcales cyanobacterium]|jgi:aspartyl-tRNA(Asn)/glutamyl-tRNA(Gln) amidotransferase subunit A